MKSSHSDGLSRRGVIRAGAFLGVSTVVLPSASAAASPADGTPATTAFTAAGSYVVPDGVTGITVLAEGTAGGLPSPVDFIAGHDADRVARPTTIVVSRGATGAGGSVLASVPVTPGETLEVVLGASRAGTTYTYGNANGDPVTLTGGAGGRAIGIRRGGTWLVVAGGGGGGGLGGYSYDSGSGGYWFAESSTGGDGGAAGTDGEDGNDPATTGGGGGATSSAPGVGGSGRSIGGPFTGAGSSGGAPTDTTLGVGGASSVNLYLIGGSGGSGYYGGGGGGSADGGDDSGGGGGGGSDFFNSSVSVTLLTQTTSGRTLDEGPRLTITLP